MSLNLHTERLSTICTPLLRLGTVSRLSMFSLDLYIYSVDSDYFHFQYCFKHAPLSTLCIVAFMKITFNYSLSKHSSGEEKMSSLRLSLSRLVATHITQFLFFRIPNEKLRSFNRATVR